MYSYSQDRFLTLEKEPAERTDEMALWILVEKIRERFPDSDTSGVTIQEINDSVTFKYGLSLTETAELVRKAKKAGFLARG